MANTRVIGKIVDRISFNIFSLELTDNDHVLPKMDILLGNIASKYS